MGTVAACFHASLRPANLLAFLAHKITQLQWRAEQTNAKYAAPTQQTFSRFYFAEAARLTPSHEFPKYFRVRCVLSWASFENVLAFHVGVDARKEDRLLRLRYFVPVQSSILPLRLVTVVTVSAS